jgi:hypothetical protein
MWIALSLIGMLATTMGLSDPLTISNVRPTYGIFGSERPDHKVVAGDTYMIAFDIEGLRSDDSGRVRYTMAMEVTDSKGKVVFAQNPRDLEGFSTLGGSRLPAFSHLDTLPTQTPGEYTIKVTVIDRTTKATQQLVHRFEILPKAFSIVRLSVSADPDMQFRLPPIGVPGQTLWLKFFTVSFERDPIKRQPDLQVEMRILDENGKPTLPKPNTGEVNDEVAEAHVAIPWQFRIELNRPGKFTIEARATDRISKKESKVSVPLKVMDQKASAANQ